MKMRKTKKTKINPEKEALLNQKKEELYQMAIHFVIRTQKAHSVDIMGYVKVPLEEGWYLSTNYELANKMLERMVEDKIIRKVPHEVGQKTNDEWVSRNVVYTYEVIRKRVPFPLNKVLMKELKKMIKSKQQKEKYRQKEGELFLQAINKWIKEETGLSFKEVCEGENAKIYHIKTDYVYGEYQKTLTRNGEFVSKTIINVKELMEKTKRKKKAI